MSSHGWSLQARLKALFVATIIPVVGLGIYWLILEAHHERRHAKREAFEMTARVAAQAADVVGDVQGMLAVLARLPLFRVDERAKIDRLLQELVAAVPYIENLSVFTADGALYASGVPVAAAGQILVHDRAWFQAAVRSRQPVASGFLLGRIVGRPVVVLARPLLDREGQILGVVGASLRLEAVGRKVAPVQPRSLALWAIVDDQGLVLLHHDPQAPSGQPLGPLPGMFRAESAVPGTQWRAIVAIGEAVVAARVRSSLLEIGLPAVLILLVASGVGFWIARNTWRPLQALTVAVRRIGAGEREVPLPVEAPGEVSEVAVALRDALGAVAAREADLTRRHEELAALVEASRAVATSLDLDQSLQAVVQQASIISGTNIVRLLLLDQQAKVLRCRVVVGLPDEENRDIVIPVGESFLSGQVAASGKPLVVADIRNDPRLINPQHAAKHGLVSYFGLPVKLGDRVVGVIVFNTQAPRTYSDEDIAYLSAFADQAAIAIENARLHSAAVQRGEELEALLRATRLVMSGLELKGILDRILTEAAVMSRCPNVKIFLVDRKAGTLRVEAARGLVVRGVGFVLPLGSGLVGLVAQTEQPVFSEDLTQDPRNPNAQQDRELGLVTYLGLPIKIRDEVLGVLTFRTTAPRHYSLDEVAYLSAFADQAAIAIENAQLYAEVRRHAEELEARVRQRTAGLEEALRVKMEFLSKISHELRTPLNFILGFSDLLRQGVAGPLSPKQATYLDRIQGGGRRLLSLVTDVLDIAQVDVGKSHLQLEPVVVGPLVQEVLGLVQVQASQKQLHISTSLDPWLSFIVADRFKLAQILFRLVSNAVKFTPAGGSITVTARQVGGDVGTGAGEHGSRGESAPQRPSAPAPQQFVEIVVEDTGIGIRPEDLETIFAAFHQVDGSDIRAYEGVGLGLTLVRRFVEQHGGRVWAESPGLGQGARFIVRLPRLEIPRAKTVLFVEDDEVTRASMTSALEAAGFKVIQAADGSQALAALAGEPPDLLVLDLVLPDMDGWEILRRVRGAEEIPRFPVLVITGLEGASAEEALRLGADEFLAKPVSPRVFVDTVLRLLSQPAVGRRVKAAEESRD